jgi:beta-catenin-like protein 1
MLKRLRTEESSPSVPMQSAPPSYNGKGKARAVTIEDVAEDEDGAQEEDFAPGGDPDYYAEEDEDGRFFGGGLTVEQKKILNLFDGTGREDVANEEVRTP